MLSPHFATIELACPCCGECVIDQALIDALEQLRDLVAKPVLVHSGYRCAQHNAAVGGAHGSEHLRGQAADISVDGLTLPELLVWIDQVPRFASGGIGLYRKDGHIHVDVRATPARW